MLRAGFNHIRELRHSAGVQASARSRFVTGAFWSLVGSAASRGLVLLATIAAARLLGAGEYGELGIIQVTVALFGTLAGIGLGLTATKHVAESRAAYPDRAGRYIGLVLLTTFVAGTVMTMLLIVFAEPLSVHVLGRQSLTGPVRISSGLVAFGAITSVQTGALLGLENYRAHASLTVLRGSSSAFLSVVGIWTAGLEGAVTGLVVGEAATVVVGMIMLRRSAAAQLIRIRYRGLTEEFPVLWRFSIPALLASLLIMPALLMSNVLLARSSSYADVGVFTAAYKWNAIILFVPAALSLTQLPLLSNLRAEGKIASFNRALRLYVLLSAGLTLLPAAVVAILSQSIMALHGADFASGGATLAIMALASIPMGLNAAIGQAVLSASGIAWRVVADALLSVTLTVSCVLLIPRYGAEGLAASYFFAFSTATVLLILVLRRVTYARTNTVSRQDPG